MYDMVHWYGMVWYGMVWYGMVWYGMVWSTNGSFLFIQFGMTCLMTAQASHVMMGSTWHPSPSITNKKLKKKNTKVKRLCHQTDRLEISFHKKGQASFHLLVCYIQQFFAFVGKGVFLLFLFPHFLFNSLVLFHQKNLQMGTSSTLLLLLLLLQIVAISSVHGSTVCILFYSIFV